MVTRFSKAAAYHEAAHAVGRVVMGFPATAITLGRSGGGITHGSGGIQALGQHGAWALLVCLFAGAYAEARVSRRSRAAVLWASGRSDLEAAVPVIRWLINGRHTKSRRHALLRVDVQTRVFVSLSWPAIDRVARQLRKAGRLKAHQVRSMVAQGGSLCLPSLASPGSRR